MIFPPEFDLKAAWPERLDPPGKSGGGEMTNMGCYAIDFAEFAQGATAVGSVEQLIAAIETGTPPTSNAATGLAATEVLMAAYRSIVEERPIPLPLESGANPLIVAVRS